MSDGAMLWHRECVQCQRALQAAEARCKQKDAALRIALEELEFDRDFAVVKGSDEKRKVDEAIGLVRAALSDTAQQETGRALDKNTITVSKEEYERLFPIDPETAQQETGDG